VRKRRGHLLPNLERWGGKTYTASRLRRSFSSRRKGEEKGKETSLVPSTDLREGKGEGRKPFREPRSPCKERGRDPRDQEEGSLHLACQENKIVLSKGDLKKKGGPEKKTSAVSCSGQLRRGWPVRYKKQKEGRGERRER